MKRPFPVLLVVLLSMPAAVAQDAYVDQWNIRGTAEEDAQRFESSLRPTRFDERLASDELNRSDNWLSTWRQPSADASPPLADFNHAVEAEPAFDAPITAGHPACAPGSGTLADPFSTDPVVPAGFRRMHAPDEVFAQAPDPCRSCGWHMLPAGLLYPSYLAGPKEPRMQFTPLRDLENNVTYWEAVLGGRVGIVRYGTCGAQNPEGFQLDLEGAVFARVLPDQPSAALAASDYRAGLLTTWKTGGTAVKAGYYHISSHVGDEYLLLVPGFVRINYVRDSLIAGIRQEVTAATQLYGEIGCAVGHQGGAEPLELQFGAEYAPMESQRWGGAPFAGINGQWREEFSGQTGLNVVAGWNWQGAATGHRLRLGLQFYDGPSLQYQFFDQQERLIGGGIWLDY